MNLDEGLKCMTIILAYKGEHGIHHNDIAKTTGNNTAK